MTEDDLGNLTETEHQKINIELKAPAANMIRGLAKLYKITPQEIVRYLFTVGRAILHAYQTGGEAYIRDRTGKISKIPPPKSTL